MMTTCLPFAKNVERRIEFVAVAALVLLRQELHGEVNAFQFASRDHEVARLLRAASQQDGVELSLQILHRHVFSDVRVGDELDAFALHLFQHGGR